MTDKAYEIGNALKPLLKRIRALEKDSHPPVDWDVITEEVFGRVISRLNDEMGEGNTSPNIETEDHKHGRG